MGIAGDPTEAALLVVARKAGMNEYLLRDAAARFDEIPFDARLQSMATLHHRDGARVMFVKGLWSVCCRAVSICLIEAAPCWGWIQPRCSRWRMSWPRVACACWHSRVAPAMRNRARISRTNPG